MSYEIPFTFYQLPDGRRSQNMFVTEKESVHDKAKKIMAAGFMFESEILTTGQAHITITGSNCDVKSIISENDVSIRPKVEEMILSFNIEDGLAMNEEAG